MNIWSKIQYLGIMFSAKFCWFTGLRTLASHTIKFINYKYIILYLFRKLVLPILFYGCEIWGYIV